MHQNLSACEVTTMGDAIVGGWEYPADVRANTMCSVSTKTDIPLPLSPPVVVSCFFNPACLSEVVNVISKLKNRENKILDISPILLKENIILFGNHL